MAIQLASAAINAPRDAHYERDPVSGLYRRSLLIEDTRTNALTWSNDLTNAAWTKTRASSALTVTGPDGAANSASTLIEDATASNTHFLQRTLTGATASTVQAVTFYAKAGARNWIALQIFDKASAFGSQYINLTGGALGTITGTIPVTIALTALANGWYRITATFNAGVGVGDPLLRVLLATANGTSSYTGDGVSGVSLSQFQWEADRPFASSSITTVGSTLARSLDVHSVPFPFAPCEMTIYLEWIERGTLQLTSKGYCGIGTLNAVTYPALFFAAGTPGVLNMTHRYDVGGTVVNATMACAAAIGDLVRARAILNANGSVQIGHSLNGAAETLSAVSAVGALASAWSANLFWIGSLNGVSQGFAAFTAVKVQRGVQSLATMMAA